MRTPQMIDPLTESMDDCDDIFGPPRSYPTGYCPPRNRPSMISSKYKQKEERRRVLKISLNKLRKIDDPEASLCRSVLINNTMKRLQQETRSEKMQKQQFNYPRCYNNDNYLNIKTEFMKNEKPVDVITAFAPGHERIEDIIIEKDFDAKLEEEINHISANDITTINSLVRIDDIASPVPSHKQHNNRLLPKKRTFDEMDECEMHEALSQFYLPPTPRMLTGIDEDEDLNVVDDDPLTKRLKKEDQTSANSNNNTDLVCHTTFSNYSNSVTSFINNNLPLPKYNNSFIVESDSNPFSCGHASMLVELQSNPYHNLITSLET